MVNVLATRRLQGGRSVICIKRNGRLPDATACTVLSFVVGTRKLGGFRIDAVRKCPALSTALLRLGRAHPGDIALIPLLLMYNGRAGRSVTNI